MEEEKHLQYIEVPKMLEQMLNKNKNFHKQTGNSPYKYKNGRRFLKDSWAVGELC